MAVVSIPVQREPSAEGLPLPQYASGGASGMDLYACVAEEVEMAPGERALIPTGVRMSIPEGYEGQVRGRSGLALKKGIGLVNAPGTIDSDYRGEIQVILINWSSERQTIRRGERIAQLVIAPVVRAELVEAEDLPDSERGAGGFGHTGTR